MGYFLKKSITKKTKLCVWDISHKVSQNNIKTLYYNILYYNMTKDVRFNRDEYAKSYYKEYYQNNKEKINQARKKRITINRIETLYGVKLDDDLYAMYNENRELYNRVFKQLKQNKKQTINYANINPHLVEHFNTHIIV